MKSPHFPQTDSITYLDTAAEGLPPVAAMFRVSSSLAAK